MALAATQPLSPSPVPRSDPPNKEIRNRLIREVALNSLVEIGAMTLIIGFCSRFATTPEVKTIFIRDAAWVAGLNLLARSTAALYKHVNDNHLLMRTLGCITDHIAPANFAFKFHDFTTRCFIHETGHLIAYFLLAQKVQAQIVAKPSGDSEVRWRVTGTYEFSEHSIFRRYYSHLLIEAGGTIANVIAAQIALTLGLRVKKSYPQLSKYLIFSAALSVINETYYALSALSLSHHDKNSLYGSHDFFVLWKEYKIHPIVAAVSIVALPTITTVAYLYAQNKVKSQKTLGEIEKRRL